MDEQIFNVEYLLHAILDVNGYDGLCNPTCECGCTLDDLMPCGHVHSTECVAGYERTLDDGATIITVEEEE